MPENTQATSEVEKPDGYTVRIDSELKPELQDVTDYFQFERIATAVRNTIRVGCRLAKESPTEFLRLLNGNA